MRQSGRPRRSVRRHLLLFICLLVAGWPVGMTAGPTPPAMPGGGVTFVGAGDIASCANDNDEATAQLLDRIGGTVFTLGDNVYDDGSAEQFANCYAPTWGRHLDRTYPVPGNHEYHTPGARAYFAYFAPRVGDPGAGYYSFDLGGWHIVALNSNCEQIGGCDTASAQYAWLQADLSAHPARCTIALTHHPRFSSGGHGDDQDLTAFWGLLYASGVEIVLSGHDHDYERFAPQEPNGRPDPRNGIRQFVVGTGGANLREFETLAPNSEARDASTFGVLELTLQPAGYTWQFVPVAGSTFTDAGSDTCH